MLIIYLHNSALINELDLLLDSLSLIKPFFVSDPNHFSLLGVPSVIDLGFLSTTASVLSRHVFSPFCLHFQPQPLYNYFFYIQSLFICYFIFSSIFHSTSNMALIYDHDKLILINPFSLFSRLIGKKFFLLIILTHLGLLSRSSFQLS